MARIRVRVEAYILNLFPATIPEVRPARPARPRPELPDARHGVDRGPGPAVSRPREESAHGARRDPGPAVARARLESLDLGLALPSFWSRHEIAQAFDDANRIWIREADIEFTPVTVTERTESVPSDERDMWIHFVNHLPPSGRGVGVGFVYDLPSHEGGWGGGRVAVISGRTVGQGLPGYAGNLLAHELGHVLIDDPNHTLAQDDPSNLMYDRRNPRQANAGMLNERQVGMARTRAIAL